MNTGCDTSGAARWLVEGAGAATQPQQVMAQFCERLIAAGLPLWRAAVFVRTLHPAVMGRRLLWQPDLGVRITEAGFGRLDEDVYRHCGDALAAIGEFSLRGFGAAQLVVS